MVCHRALTKRRLLKYGVTLAFFTLLAQVYFHKDEVKLNKHDIIQKYSKLYSPRGPLTRRPSTPPANVQQLLESMNKRRDRVRKVCSDPDIRRKSEELSDHTLVSRMHHFVYCPVEKSASTFWRRFLYQLEFTNPMQSPFNVSVREAYDGMTSRVKVFEKGKKLKKLLEAATKVIFVRDPFYRLFSAYVDKLMSPNPFYWELWGLPATRKYRPEKQALKGAKLCGSNVTFPEFIHLVTDELWLEESHVMPISRMCDPCGFNYTVIGKLETFTRDTRLVLEYLGLNENQVGLDRMSHDVFSDAVRDSVTDALSDSWLNMTLKCVSRTEVARRIWRKLQLRGFISWRLNFELRPEDVKTLQSGDFIDILEAAAKASAEFQDLRFQKRQALQEALKSLKSWQYDEIMRIFTADFLMFGYNSSELLGNLHNVKTTGAFDWWKDWDLSALV
ncbi:carbohydrate sulfotransferase 10 [Biomphalaria pfeifferi]|uniref:Carbohydrate sulfotransferase n=1 Tax=Biomphalaria pfeifferi TaxID=112525 RepID=A0AAD8B0U1_BIOPF|nr:carbohydrate sulfotransferase 10 [Biomphalaria pfeifferi]